MGSEPRRSQSRSSETGLNFFEFLNCGFKMKKAKRNDKIWDDLKDCLMNGRYSFVHSSSNMKYARLTGIKIYPEAKSKRRW